MHPHARAAIISIGDELTLGQSPDTNAGWLANQLLSRGITAIEHTTLPDSLTAIAQTLARLIGEADLIISTGGLGPTADDLTRPAVADAINQPLVEDPDALSQIQSYFASRCRDMPLINRTQALRPKTAESLANPHGTAPGIAARTVRCDIFCLPGPPHEMKPMFERQVTPRLRPPRGHTIQTRLIHTHGLSESEVAMRLGDLMSRSRNPLIGTTASQAIITCRIRYEGPADGIDGITPDQSVIDTASLIHQRLDPYIFGEDGQSLAAATLDLLRSTGRTFATVESCTGGMLAGMITEVPGASDLFPGGWITYSNQAKQRDVDVPAHIFAPGGPGAVSRDCALAMARGGLARSGADECVAITGIAGPGGGTAQKPIGTVWIAVASRQTDGHAEHVRHFLVPGGRDLIRDWSCKAALGMLRLRLLGLEELPLVGEQG